MKVREHLERASESLISFEIIPPYRGSSIDQMLTVVEHIKKYEPPFIDVTSHASSLEYHETAQGIEKIVRRKRVGTLGICSVIQHKYKIDAVPHILCQGFTREETEDLLIELEYVGIENVLAIRGDRLPFKKEVKNGRSTNKYANELVSQIKNMNNGKYLKETDERYNTNFNIGVAGYPEKHIISPNLERDIERLKDKVDAGADYIVTQMFFRNEHYFNFVSKCREKGIDVPIIPGIKIIKKKSHLSYLPRFFNCEIPKELSDEIENSNSRYTQEIGMRWAKKQTEELINKGVPAVHYFLMQDHKAACKIIESLGTDKLKW